MDKEDLIGPVIGFSAFVVLVIFIALSVIFGSAYNTRVSGEVTCAVVRTTGEAWAHVVDHIGDAVSKVVRGK